MSRILLVSERFWPEEFIVNDLAAALAAGGDEVTVLTQQPSYPRGRLFKGYRNRLLSRERWSGAEVVRIKTVPGYRESLFYKLLNYAWFVFEASLVAVGLIPRFDAVLVYQTGPLTGAVPAIIASRIGRKPAAIWTQDVWPDSVYAYGFKKTPLLSSLLDAFVGWAYGSVAAVLVSCRGFADILGKYSGKDMVYAPNWPLTRYAPGPGLPRGRRGPVFLFAGNVGKLQNLENVIRGFAAAALQDGILRIVGDGSALQSLRALATELGADVEFAGRRPSSEIGEEYDAADFLVLSLADEPVLRLTVPSKFQMYLSVGKPILCAAGGEVARLVRDLDLGVAADPSDPVAIGKAFRELRDASGERLRSWSENGSKAFSEEFDRDRIIAVIRETLRRIE